MVTNLEQVALLTKFNCCYAELSGKVASKLGKYKLCNLKAELREMKLARAYIYRIHKYHTLISKPSFGTLITFIRPDVRRITVTIVINGVSYTLSNTVLELSSIISYFITVLQDVGFLVIPYGVNGIIVYSYNIAFDDAIVTGTITSPNTITISDYTSSITDILLDTDNCLSREQICGIINQACCILDKYCTT